MDETYRDSQATIAGVDCSHAAEKCREAYTAANQLPFHVADSLKN